MQIPWNDHYETVLPYVFSIETPEGSGSGFFLMPSAVRPVIAVATAAHVIQRAHDWNLPLRLRHHKSGKSVFVESSERGILIDAKRDSAVIVFNRGDLSVPDEPLPMIARDKFLRPGVELAWVGYPGIATPHLCFFSGKVSAFVRRNDSYLIDGVAINGVSGGPVFHERDGKTRLIGAVSAYLPNRTYGESLPGLASVQDVTAFHAMISSMRSVDEARKKEAENAKAASEGPSTVAPAPTKEPPPASSAAGAS